MMNRSNRGVVGLAVVGLTVAGLAGAVLTVVGLTIGALDTLRSYHLRAWLGGRPIPKPIIPFEKHWNDDFGIAMLSFVADHGRLPDSAEGFEALSPYIPLSSLDLEAYQIQYEFDANTNRFRVHIPRWRVALRGQLVDQKVLLLRGVRGTTLSYRPALEQQFLSQFKADLQPALERFYHDFGRYPCFHEWTDDVLTSRVLCRSETCAVGRLLLDASGDHWNGPYLSGDDAAALVHGPFDESLRYCDLASCQGFYLLVPAPKGRGTCEGELILIGFRAHAVQSQVGHAVHAE